MARTGEAHRATPLTRAGVNKNCKRLLRLGLLVTMPYCPSLAADPIVAQKVLRVGSGLEFVTISAAARAAKDGDVIEIEAGHYRGDVAVWSQKRLTIRGVNGRARLMADGNAAEAKAIWVIRDGQFLVENIEFAGTRVPDRNGAGIRFEKGDLVVRNCVFIRNETGILTGNDKDSELRIEGSEFGNNGAGDGQSHNLYVGRVRKLTVTDSYFHGAKAGHLLKSRAAENHVLYNRLTDEADGTASYELEFPNGGLAYVVGNIIQQGPKTQNPTLVSFGAEGYTWPRNELNLINNTLVDGSRWGGNFLWVSRGSVAIKAINNLLVGKGSLESAGAGEYRANYHAHTSDLAMAPEQDYRLKKASKLVGKGVDPVAWNGVSLRPQREYQHPTSSTPLAAGPLSPGALQRVVP
jgi:hypothetical protein